MRAELRSRRHRSALRADTGLGQRRCWARCLRRTYCDPCWAAGSGPHRGSPLRALHSVPCAVRAPGLASHCGSLLRESSPIALGSKVASDRDTVPLGGLSPSCTQGYVPAPSQRCRAVTGAFPTESLFTVYGAVHRAPGYPRLVVCSSSADKSEGSFLN